MKFVRLGAVACASTLLMLICCGARAAQFDLTRAQVNFARSVPHEIGDLYYSWRESGLPPYSTVDYSVTGEVTVTIGCLAAGAIMATQTYSGPGHVNGPFELTASRRGVIQQSYDFDPPQGGTCPADGDVVLLSISYTNPTLCDNANGVCTSLGGPLTHTYCKDGADPSNCPLF